MADASSAAPHRTLLPAGAVQLAVTLVVPGIASGGLHWANSGTNTIRTSGSTAPAPRVKPGFDRLGTMSNVVRLKR